MNRLAEHMLAEPAEVWDVGRSNAPEECVCCGSAQLEQTPVLWRELIDEWGLSKDEADYVDRQQGLACMKRTVSATSWARLPDRRLASFPDVDMTSLPFPDDSFDVVLHSDTLEHVLYPVKGLSECRRVLHAGGFCAFTVPLVVGRRTISRESLPASYHGKPGDRHDDFMVHTEYGCDVWKQVIQAGFAECRIYTVDPPAAFAIVGVK